MYGFKMLIAKISLHQHISNLLKNDQSLVIYHYMFA